MPVNSIGKAGIHFLKIHVQHKNKNVQKAVDYADEIIQRAQIKFTPDGYNFFIELLKKGQAVFYFEIGKQHENLFFNTINKLLQKIIIQYNSEPLSVTLIEKILKNICPVWPFCKKK